MVSTTTPDTAGLGMAGDLRFFCSALIGTPAPASIMTQLRHSQGFTLADSHLRRGDAITPGSGERG
jgi:hypothetical protein